MRKKMTALFALLLAALMLCACAPKAPDEEQQDEDALTRANDFEKVYDHISRNTAYCYEYFNDEGEVYVMQSSIEEDLKNTLFELYSEYLRGYYNGAEGALRYTEFGVLYTGNGYESKLRMMKPDEIGLIFCDELCMTADGEISWSPGGVYNTLTAARLWEDREHGFMLISRGEQVPCPFEMEGCENVYFKAALYLRDIESGEETELCAPQLSIQAISMNMPLFKVLQTDDGRLLIEVRPIEPHSDAPVTVTTYEFDAATRTISEGSVTLENEEI